MKYMRNVTMQDLDNYVIQNFDTDQFVYFEDGKVFADKEVGTYEEDGEFYYITFFNNDDVFVVATINKNQEIQDAMIGFDANSCAAKVKDHQCSNSPSYDRQGYKVCKTHLKSKKFVPFSPKLEDAVRDTTNKEEVMEGIRKMREKIAYTQASIDELKSLRLYIWDAEVDQIVRDKYRYGPSDLRIVVEGNIDPNDPARPGYIYYGSDYVGKIAKKDDEFLLVLDRIEGEVEVVTLPTREPTVEELVEQQRDEALEYHQMKEEAPVHKSTAETEKNITVFRCNIFQPKSGPRAGDTIFYYTKKTELAEISKQELKDTAKRLLDANKTKAIVVLGLDKPVVMTGKGDKFKSVKVNKADIRKSKEVK